VIRALAEATGVPAAKVQEASRKTGDLGDVAAALTRVKVRGNGPALAEVFERLKAIALASGPGAQETKIRLLAALLRRCPGREAKYVVRIVLGKLRLGVGEMTFLYGLSKALTGTKEHKPVLEHAYNVLSDLGEVAERAMRHGVAALRDVRPELGKPVRMMLAQRIRDLAKVPRRIPGPWHVEYKRGG
jgi:DNA ligase-1